MKTYIQIGANTGGDDFQRIIGGLPERSRVFLIEPNSSLRDALFHNYGTLNTKHEIIILSCAVSTSSGVEDFYEAPTATEHFSLLKRPCFPVGVHSQKVKTISFSDLCKEYNITEVEVLFIDTEGMDYEILNSIDLSAVDIKTIYFEKWSHDDDDLNGKYRSGPIFFDMVIRPKFAQYSWSTVQQQNMTNYKLTK